MNNILIYLTFLIKLIIINNRLIKVIIINRHGARTVKKNITQYKSIIRWRIKITFNGYKQHLILGMTAKERYTNELNFLRQKYDNTQFEIFSTQKQRTIFSAEGFISGFYPDTLYDIIFDDQKKFPNISNNDVFLLMIIKIMIMNSKKKFHLK